MELCFYVTKIEMFLYMATDQDNTVSLAVNKSHQSFFPQLLYQVFDRAALLRESRCRLLCEVPVFSPTLQAFGMMKLLCLGAMLQGRQGHYPSGALSDREAAPRKHKETLGGQGRQSRLIPG